MLSKRIIILITCIQSTLFGCSQEPSPEESTALTTPNNPPNIVFIYTDDQAPWALGASGNKEAITPNLDRLANEGMYLPNAYTTTPVCSPSRAGLLTSRYGYELGIDDWINTKYKSLHGTEAELGLDTRFPTWVEILRDQGYATGLVGKWHLGETDQHHPSVHGYQEFIGFREGGTSTENPKIEKDGIVSQRSGLTADILTSEAIYFINKHQHKHFMLSLNFRAPHTNWLPVSAEDAAPYKAFTFTLPNPDYPDLDTTRAQKMMGEYLSSVRSIDRNVGRILDHLESAGLTDKTVVIFTSDHGYTMGHNGIWHKGNGHWLLTKNPEASANIPSGQRPNMYDNSIKVPTIIKWPGTIKPNSQSLQTISNLDWFPTLIDIAQAPLPQNTGIHGNSFLPLLLGKSTYQSSDYYAAYSTRHQSKTHMRMYSNGKFKLIKDYLNKGRDEFYNLQVDPSESTNLILTADPELKKVINRFDNIIYKKMLSTNDPVINSIFGLQH